MSAKDIAEYGEKIWALCKTILMWCAEQTSTPLGTVIVIVAAVVVAYLFAKLIFRRKE